MRAISFILLLCLLLCLGVPLSGQQTSKSESWIIRGRFSGGDGSHFTQEVGLIYGDHKDEPDTLAAIRVCSKNRFPQALFTSALNPIAMQQFLADFYNYSPDRVRFLRSEDCLGPRNLPDVVEPWIVPKGAVMPAAVESIKSCQVDFELIPSGESHLASGFGFTEDIKTLSGYRAALRKLISKLKERPKATGIVLGGYFVDVSDRVSSRRYNRVRVLMRRRIDEARKMFERSGLSSDRYFLRLQPWVTAACDYGCEPQPKFPHLSIVEIQEVCPVKRAAMPNNGMHPTANSVALIRKTWR